MQEGNVTNSNNAQNPAIFLTRRRMFSKNSSFFCLYFSFAKAAEYGYYGH